MRAYTISLLVLSVALATTSLHAGDDDATSHVETAINDASALKRVEGWLKQFENEQAGHLPESFRVRIQFNGYMNRETKDGTNFYRPREIYEFTPKEVRRLCVRVAGVDKDGATKYRVDDKGRLVYEVAARKPFTKIDRVCRILHALDYLKMVETDDHAQGKNFHYLQVMTDSGLRPLGDVSIDLKAVGAELTYCESCLFGGALESAHSIRFAALYHTLRRLARSELGLSGGYWDDALDVIDADGSVKPAVGTFRARE